MKQNENISTMVQLEDIKALLVGMKNNKMEQSKIERLTAKMAENTIVANEQIEALSKVITEIRKPVVRENKFAFDITSKSGFSLFALLFGAVIVMAVLVNNALTPNYDERDNDLKYRYIKMKGSATSATIAELEDLFEINRNTPKIRQMRSDIEAFELAVAKRAHLDEQARLNAAKANAQNEKANAIKGK